MPVQDLTPQLRTRLSRVERTVGWFVIVATLLLVAAFGYYVYHTAKRKGWFLLKLPYHTYVASAAGLHVDDPVMMMGFNVGQITEITAMPPFYPYGNVYIQFIIREPYYGYVWTDSYLKLTSSGFLGNRSVEVVQGGTSGRKDLHPSYDIKNGKPVSVWNIHSNIWVSFASHPKGFAFTNAQEEPLVTDRLSQIADQAQKALPGILDLTNQIGRVLSNTAQLTAHADELLAQARPLMTNLTAVTGLLTNGPGSLGDWLIPTNINRELQSTLATANTTLGSANTNVTMVAVDLDKTLINLANITSNLNVQVQSNNQILTQISATIVHSDDFIQGLKRFWLLRHLFKNENQPPPPKSGKR